MKHLKHDTDGYIAPDLEPENEPGVIQLDSQIIDIHSIVDFAPETITLSLRLQGRRPLFSPRVQVRNGSENVLDVEIYNNPLSPLYAPHSQGKYYDEAFESIDFFYTGNGLYKINNQEYDIQNLLGEQEKQCYSYAGEDETISCLFMSSFSRHHPLYQKHFMVTNNLVVEFYKNEESIEKSSQTGTPFLVYPYGGISTSSNRHHLFYEAGFFKINYDQEHKPVLTYLTRQEIEKGWGPLEPQMWNNKGQYILFQPFPSPEERCSVAQSIESGHLRFFLSFNNTPDIKEFQYNKQPPAHQFLYSSSSYILQDSQKQTVEVTFVQDPSNYHIRPRHAIHKPKPIKLF
jgi:hypothetical protein